MFIQEVADDASFFLCDRDIEPFGQIAKPPIDLGMINLDIQFGESFSYLVSSIMIFPLPLGHV
ncbi:MAG: hypothetical protein C4B59_03135 [Candidatus Methanogaster sp.]|uniref:Uncharacterized protein n=1 Tax=Candidatus Methanogaster sp. TaxID=3386292 RepID=A0AC61L573_9EURY|nr:MAG: hypothetical protein C4B59_03135 [ANME-2 cluster archaeon]